MTCTGTREGGDIYDNGTTTFTNSLDKNFTKIEIICMTGDIDGWSKVVDSWRDAGFGEMDPVYKLTWEGDDESVSFQARVYNIQSIVFTISDAPAAPQAELLVTIENGGDNTSFTSGSKTFGNIATVTLSSDVVNVGDEDGWYSNGTTISVTRANDGYTITKVKFYRNGGSAFDESAPFEARV